MGRRTTMFRYGHYRVPIAYDQISTLSCLHGCEDHHADPIGAQHSSFFVLQYMSVKCQQDRTITVASYVREYFDVFSASPD